MKKLLVYVSIIGAAFTLFGSEKKASIGLQLQEEKRTLYGYPGMGKDTEKKFGKKTIAQLVQEWHESLTPEQRSNTNEMFVLLRQKRKALYDEWKERKTK